MKAKMIYVGRERGRKREERIHQVKLDKTGAFVGKTHKKNKKTGEEKCVNETLSPSLVCRLCGVMSLVLSS